MNSSTATSGVFLGVQHCSTNTGPASIHVQICVPPSILVVDPMVLGGVSPEAPYESMMEYALGCTDQLKVDRLGFIFWNF